ncbi:MAG TPA: hypothetical protein VKF62_12930, partial [Planctomycetota bacterium]|nr:hypothetical protein [Planctomycetota bacterium]
FPATPGAFDLIFGGGSSAYNPDAFVARLTASGGGLVYATFLGGTSDDEATGLVVEAGGAAIVAGKTASQNFPTTPSALDPSFNGMFDAFLARLSPSGAGLAFSSFLGGLLLEEPGGIFRSPAGGVAVVGSTNSTDFPVTAGAFATTHAGASDGFVAGLDLLPAGASAFGNSTPACAAFLPIGVTTAPIVGNAAFAVTCANAPVNTTGFLAVSGAPLASAPVFLGAEIWIDLASGFFALYVSSDGNGDSVIPFPIPSNPLLAGAQADFQFFWSNPCIPANLCASNALAVTVQP